MTFLPEDEFWRRFAAKREARAKELVGLGISRPLARAQAQKEFEIFDRMLTDERGWIHMEGLDLSERVPPTR